MKSRQWVVWQRRSRQMNKPAIPGHQHSRSVLFGAKDFGKAVRYKDTICKWTCDLALLPTKMCLASDHQSELDARPLLQVSQSPSLVSTNCFFQVSENRTCTFIIWNNNGLLCALLMSTSDAHVQLRESPFRPLPRSPLTPR